MTASKRIGKLQTFREIHYNTLFFIYSFADNNLTQVSQSVFTLIKFSSGDFYDCKEEKVKKVFFFVFFIIALLNELDLPPWPRVIYSTSRPVLKSSEFDNAVSCLFIHIFFYVESCISVVVVVVQIIIIITIVLLTENKETLYCSTVR